MLRDPLAPGVSGADGVANADDAGREDVGAEAASVDHRAQQGGAGEALQVRAGFAQPSADAAGGPDLELLADECVEVDAAGHDVATRVDRRQMEVVVAERVEDFRFDERQLLSVLLDRVEIPAGDSARFDATWPHVYANPGATAATFTLVGGRPRLTAPPRH
jgi:hypothetical protein